MVQVGKNTVYYLEGVDHPINSVDLRLVNFGVQGKDSNHSHGPTRKDEHVLQYVFSGEGTYILNNKTYKLEQNSLFYLPKNEIVKYFSNAVNPYAYYWIGVDGESVVKLISAIGLTKESPVISIDDDGITDTFESLKTAVLKDNLSGILEANSIVLKLFSLLTKANLSNDKTIKNVSMEYVNKALYFIRENFGKDVNVTKISKAVGLKRNYFDVIFKQRMGTSPIDYLISYRIEQAKIMLSSGMSVTETAINCGFNSPSNFGVKFKKMTGITPLNFKKKFSKI
ncbi:MAG: AraC family transcriptional regulator [Clostridia bacterium]|nr:AraC family transcriptional regulator [Clostridia bacterium]